MAVTPLVDNASPPTIYVDPPDGAPSEEARPDPYPEQQPNRWQFRFPWVKTAVGAPTYNNDLLIANRTDQTWLLWHNYHSLGLLDAGDERYVRVVRAGTISARQQVARPESEFLLVSLSSDLAGVEITDMSGGEGYYALRPIEAGSASIVHALPDSTRIQELKLSSRTENALRRIGVTTAGELKRADLAALWPVRNGPAAYAELVELLYLSGRNRS